MLTMADKGGRGVKSNADVGCQRGPGTLVTIDIIDKMTKNTINIFFFF